MVWIPMVTLLLILWCLDILFVLVFNILWLLILFEYIIHWLKYVHISKYFSLSLQPLIDCLSLSVLESIKHIPQVKSALISQSDYYTQTYKGQTESSSILSYTRSFWLLSKDPVPCDCGLAQSIKTLFIHFILCPKWQTKPSSRTVAQTR